MRALRMYHRRTIASMSVAAVRLRAALPAIALLTGSVVTAYSIAHYGLGHSSPALACTVALSSLSLNRDARPRRVAETAAAMVLGITLSATAVTLTGRGPVQIAVTLLIVLGFATLVSRSPAFALSAATQAMLVAVLADPEGGPYMRALDGAIGGCVALLATAVIPRAPFVVALRTGESAIREIADCAHLIALALDSADTAVARQAVKRLRALDAPLENWRVTLESARAVAAFSPLSRRGRSAWVSRLTMYAGLDSAAKNLRMVARRASVLTLSGRPQPRIAEVVRDIATGLDKLVAGHSDLSARKPVGFDSALRGIAGVTAERSVDQGLVAMLRPVLVDCLMASGMAEASALSALPTIDVSVRTASIPLPGKNVAPGDRPPL